MLYNGNMNINYNGASNSTVGDVFQMLGMQGDEAKNTEFKRQQIAQDNQLQRDLFYMNKANEFNAQEAQKNRDWQTEMSNSEIQRRVNDLRKAGLNPILAINQGGASTPSGSSASSSGSRSSSGYSSSGSSSNIVGAIINAVAGIYGTASTNATKVALAELMSDNKKEEMRYGSKLRMSEFDYMRKKSSQSNEDYFKKFNQRWYKK